MEEERKKSKKTVSSLETIKNIRSLLPNFYGRGKQRQEENAAVAWCMAGVPPEILAAFRLPWEWPENYSTICAIQGVALSYIELAEADGYCQDLCGYVRNTLGYCKRMEELGDVPPEAPLGGMGNPCVMLGSGFVCDPRTKWLQAAATRFAPVPMYNLDPVSPAWDIENIESERVADHYKTQMYRDLEGLVAFLQKELGRSMDGEILKKQVANAQQVNNLLFEIYQMRKNVPSPMTTGDYFAGAMIPQLFMPGEEESVNFYRQLHAEVENRVANRRGVLPAEEEKFRLIWLGLPPWFNLKLFNFFEQLQAVCAIEVNYFAGMAPLDVCTNDPLENIVERTWQQVLWNHKCSSEAMDTCSYTPMSNSVGSRLLQEWVKDYQIDGAVIHRVKSCRAATLGQVHNRNELAREGVPSLIFESDIIDPRTWADAAVKNRIQTFLETLDSPV